jgi:hypothetical protein
MRFCNRVLILCAALLSSSPMLNKAHAAGGPALTSKDARVELQLPDGWQVQEHDRRSVGTKDDGYYVLLISENKDDFADLKAYGKLVIDHMLEKFSEGKASEGRPVKLGDRPALRYEITGTSAKGLRLAYVVTVVETKAHFNQVVSWTLNSQFAANRQDMGELANGVHEVAAAPPR